MRQFQLYVRKNKHYEVVPVGFSWGALMLGPIWATIYGLLIRYLAVVAISTIPIPIALLFEGSLRDYIALVGVVTMNAGHIYFSFRAFEWRRLVLVSREYEAVASISANSSRLALEKWSMSDDAIRFMDNAA